jgi:predicted SprT family Zn-dependent metalloprotease
MNPTQQIYKELQQLFDHFNDRLFNNELPPCLLTLQRHKNTYGYFSKNRFTNTHKEYVSEIALNPEYFSTIPIVEVAQTVVHEMVHFLQFLKGKPGRGRYHNKEWANMMKEVGLMPSSTGKPGGKETGDRMADYPIEGGLFLKAFDELMTNEFKISWADRFPPKEKIINSINTGETKIEEWGDLTIYGLIENPQNGMVEPITENKSNRVKFSCPKCNSNIWAKPKIKAICGDCNIPFEC